MTDRQRLAFAVNKVFKIKQSWNELSTQGVIATNHFDEDSARLVRDYKNYLSFEAVFRLVPDLLEKGFKLVELSKIWYNCGRRLAGAEPAQYHTIQHFFTQIETCDQVIKAMDKHIERKKDQRAGKQIERKMLVNRILRFDEVKEKYDRCVNRERELKEYYKQLKGERNTEYPKLDSLPRDTIEYKECYEQIQYLAESMKGVYHELQTASYELELVKQDYTVAMANRTNLIHMQNDVKAAIQDIDISLPLDAESRWKSCHTCDKLRANIARMWTALYEANASQLLIEQADILLLSKYSSILPIDDPSRYAASHSHHSSSDDDPEEFEQMLDNTLTEEMEYSTSLERQNTDQSEAVESPAPPLPPPVTSKGPEEVPKQKSVLNSSYNPSTAGILDSHEAKRYRQRVDRLKKKFELDLSGLKTTVDCHVDASVVESAPKENKVAKAASESGDEADMDSDEDRTSTSRPQSKRLVKRNPDRFSPLSDTSDDYIYQRQVKHTPGAYWFQQKYSKLTVTQFTKCTVKHATSTVFPVPLCNSAVSTWS